MARIRIYLRRLMAMLRRRADASQRATEELEREVVLPAHAGPGWFDSSWELIRGLEVSEARPGDTRFDAWLDACVRTASAVAERHEQPGARLVPASPHGAFGDALQFGDLDLAVAAEVAHLDQFSEFGIDSLELV